MKKVTFLLLKKIIIRRRKLPWLKIIKMFQLKGKRNKKLNIQIKNNNSHHILRQMMNVSNNFKIKLKIEIGLGKMEYQLQMKIIKSLLNKKIWNQNNKKRIN